MSEGVHEILDESVGDQRNMGSEQFVRVDDGLCKHVLTAVGWQFVRGIG